MTFNSDELIQLLAGNGLFTYLFGYLEVYKTRNQEAHKRRDIDSRSYPVLLLLTWYEIVSGSAVS